MDKNITGAGNDGSYTQPDRIGSGSNRPLTSNPMLARVERVVEMMQKGQQPFIGLGFMQEVAAALRSSPETTAKPSTGCSIHGPCPVCRALDVLGDPRVGVQLAGPDAGATFRVGATLYNPAPNAAAAAQPGVFVWVCTKHGNIPFQDCAQCERERSAVKSDRDETVSHIQKQEPLT